MPEFKATDEVRLRSDPDQVGLVARPPVVRGGVVFVPVRFYGGRSNPIDVPADDLELIVAPVSGRERLVAGSFGSKRYLRSRLTYEKLANPLRDVLYSLRAARTDFLPHQFKPVLKFLESPANGLLIADEVGLGKTIEAGYILKELRARRRQEFRRALVVCPAGLRQKWQQELNHRFGEAFEIADSQDLRKIAAKVSNDDRHEFCVVVSYQTLRSGSVRPVVEELGPINLTIIDEAHHFRNPSTQTHEVAECLREISDNLIMLSATPVQLGDHNLHALLRLIAPDLVGDYPSFSGQFIANREVVAASRLVVSGDPEARNDVTARLDGLIASQSPGVPLTAVRAMRDRVAEADLTSRAVQLELRSEIRELSPLATLMSRTRKREVSERVPLRKALQPEVALTPEERIVYDFFTDLTRKSYGTGAAKRDQQVSRFRSVALQQQMASCLPAFLETAVFGSDGRAAFGDFEAMDDAVGSDDDFAESEKERHKEGVRHAEQVKAASAVILGSRIDSKLGQLLSVMNALERQHPGGKLVVFSFYKRTLAYLAKQFESRGIGFELISGDVSATRRNGQTDERSRRVDRFHDDPTVRVLLSSEVGSEGLDFQRASNVVIHYDLPWNPMKVEQRIGRVDRHGQPHEVVYSVAFAIPGTIEERIRKVLHERIGVFRGAIGDLEDIISTQLHEIEQIVMSPSLTEAQREEQLSRLADVMLTQAEQRRRLEDEAIKLMGHDDSFDQELALLERSGRALSAEEIAEFVEEALDSDGVRAVPVRDRGRRGTTVDDVSRLQDFLRKHLPKGVWGRVSLLSELKTVALWLDYVDSRSDHFVTAHHPVVHAAMALRREAHEADDEPVVALRLRQSQASAGQEEAPGLGLFVFALTRVEDSGTLRDSYSICADAVRVDGERLPTGVGERLVQTALGLGEDAPALQLPSGDAGRRALEALDLEIVGRGQARQAELRERHGRNQAMRLESIRSKTVTELGRVRARIEGQGFDSRSAAYRNMILGQRRKLEQALAQIEIDFERRRQPSVKLQTFAYGLIEVAP